MCEKYEQEHGYPLPEFIYDFLFDRYYDVMDEHDPMDVVDVLITDRIYGKNYNLPVDIITFDFRGDAFARYHTPMVVVDGMKGSLWWNYMVPVSISEAPEIMISEKLLQKRSNLSPEEWDSIFAFIKKNYDTLLADWKEPLAEDEDVIKIYK